MYQEAHTWIFMDIQEYVNIHGIFIGSGAHIYTQRKRLKCPLIVEFLKWVPLCFLNEIFYRNREWIYSTWVNMTLSLKNTWGKRSQKKNTYNLVIFIQISKQWIFIIFQYKCISNASSLYFNIKIQLSNAFHINVWRKHRTD